MATQRIWWGSVAACAVGVTLLGWLSAAAQTTNTPSAESVPETDATVTVVTIDEEIRAGTHQFLARALRTAAEQQHELVLIELNTPGGLLSATEDISRALIESPVPTVVYVNQDAGWAFSAGVFVLLSADSAAMHPTASIGAAQPVVGSGGAASEKTTNATISWLRSLAERGERDADTAATFVTENRTMGATTALETGMVDAVADSRATVLDELGYSRNAVVVTPEPTILDALLSFFSIPYLVPLLLTLGSLGLFLAVRTGEVEVTGAVSLVLLLLGLWGSGMIALSVVGVIVLVVGILLVVLELTLGGSDFGASGVLGLLAILFGTATFAQEPLFPDVFSYGLFPVFLAVFMVGAAVLFALSYFTARALTQPHAVGMESLVGQQATVQQALAPRGVVLLDGERYTATLDIPELHAAIGEVVVVTATNGNVLTVAPVARQ